MNIPLGDIKIYPGANEEDVKKALEDHAHGRWGSASLSEKIENCVNSVRGGNIGSVHRDRNGQRFFIDSNGDETEVVPG